MVVLKCDVDSDDDDDEHDDGATIMATICHSCSHSPFEGALGAPQPDTHHTLLLYYLYYISAM